MESWLNQLSSWMETKEIFPSREEKLTQLSEEWHQTVIETESLLQAAKPLLEAFSRIAARKKE